MRYRVFEYFVDMNRIPVFILLNLIVYSLQGQCTLIISPNAPESGCITTTEEVLFTNIAGTLISGSTLTKTAPGNGWNSGAASINSVKINGLAQTVINQTNTERAFGLSQADNGTNVNTIQYALHLNSNGTLQIRESGTLRSNAGSYANGDTLKIWNDNGTIRYLKNSTVLYSSSLAPSSQLIIDISLRSSGSRLAQITLSHKYVSSFSASATDNVGNWTWYSWTLNGVGLGGNSPNIIISSYSNGDVLSCTMLSFSSACFGFRTSNSIILSGKVEPTTEFYIVGTVEPGGNDMAIEDVRWKNTSLANVTVSGNSLSKNQNSSLWNAGASSFNTVKNNGYFQFTASETNRRRAIGLSTNDANVNVNSIRFAFYLENNGNLRVYESGSDRGGFGNFINGDILRIAVNTNIVRYYKNGTLIYTSNLTPTLPLLVDVSINQNGGSFQNVVVANQNQASFEAVFADAGPSTLFNWRLNGQPVGDGSAYYTASNIFDSDLITCQVSHTYSPCVAVDLASNKIEYRGSGTNWLGIIDSDWSRYGNWSNGVPEASTSAKIRSGTPFSPLITVLAPVKDIIIGAGAYLRFSNDQVLQVYGNFSNDGIFQAGTGTVAFLGDGNRFIEGETTFNRLIFNIADASDRIVLLNNAFVTNETVFLRGVLDTGTRELIYQNNATTREGSELSYIDGISRKIGNQEFKFPVGKNGTYAPIQISAPAQPTDAFTATYIDSNPGNAGFSHLERQESITTLSQCEYWMLNREVGNSVVSVTLSFENERSCGIGNPEELVVARWNGTQWENHGYLTHTGDAVSGSVTSGLPILNFSPFTLGSGTGINPLPIELLDFSLEKNERTVDLTWTTLSEINNDYFTLERSPDGIHFHALGVINGAGNSSDMVDYHFVDDAPLQGLSYYQLSQTDFNGMSESFPLRVVQFDEAREIVIYPNPSTGVFHIDYQGSSAFRQIGVYNVSGVLVMHFSTSETIARIDLSALPPGMYLIETKNGLSIEREKVMLQ